MKQILLTGGMLIAIACTAAAQMSQNDFNSLVNRFSGDCAQGPGFLNTDPNSALRSQLQGLNKVMNDEMSGLQSTISKKQAKHDKLQADMKALESAMKSENNTQTNHNATQEKANEKKDTEYKERLHTEEQILNKYSQNLSTEQNAYNDVQSVLKDVNNTADARNKGKYEDKVKRVKTDQDKIVADLNTFAATLAPIREDNFTW